MLSHIWMMFIRNFPATAPSPFARICYRCGVVKYVDSDATQCHGLPTAEEITRSESEIEA